MIKQKKCPLKKCSHYRPNKHFKCRLTCKRDVDVKVAEHFMDMYSIRIK